MLQYLVTGHAGSNTGTVRGLGIHKNFYQIKNGMKSIRSHAFHHAKFLQKRFSSSGFFYSLLTIEQRLSSGEYKWWSKPRTPENGNFRQCLGLYSNNRQRLLGLVRLFSELLLTSQVSPFG